MKWVNLSLVEKVENGKWQKDMYTHHVVGDMRQEGRKNDVKFTRYKRI
jgi:hypothetical protein